MKKYFKKFKILFCLIALLVLPYIVSASPAFNNLQKVGQQPQGGGVAPYADAGPNKLAEIVGIVIQAFLGILGVLFISYLVFAGYAWMTAQGDEEKVTKAKDTIQRAVIGLIVTIAAYAISYWVFNRLLSATGIVS